VRLHFDGQPPRDFSIASPPGADELVFHIRRIEDGTPAAYAADRLEIGETVRLEGPLGDMVLPRRLDAPLLCVAGGSGLAAIAPLVETALRRDPHLELRLYIGVQTEADVYHEDRFAGLARDCPNFRCDYVLSNAGGETRRRTGLVHEAIAADAPDLAGWRAYAAGPPAMVEALEPVLRELGLPADRLKADPFHAFDEAA
jgi:CDP-4-dehydro-6-deoxyglucose reductase/ferredoxin-NAD(P)+ reductase (naphthalene dioxygenase ferredoxin-specific)